MKKFLVFAILASLVACKKSGDTRTPEGIIIAAVQALSEGNSDEFKSLLSERALEKYGRTDQQEKLKNELGNVRRLELSKEKVLSHSNFASSSVTVSQIDVSKSGQIIYNVITRCTETRTTNTRRVCNTYDPNPPRYSDNDDSDRGNHSGGRDDDSDGGGYLTPGNSGGGHATPGPSNSGSDSDNDGRKDSNDPNRPGRFPMIQPASSNFALVTECHNVTDTDVSVSCKIIDLK